MSKFSRTPLILKAKEALGEAGLQKLDKQDKERQETQRWVERALKRQLQKLVEINRFLAGAGSSVFGLT